MTMNLSSSSNFTFLLEIVARLFIGKARSFLTKPEAYSIQRNECLVCKHREKQRKNKQRIIIAWELTGSRVETTKEY